MSNHTQEPWRVGRPGTVVSDTPVPGMGGSDAVEYYGGHLIGESIVEANARRIVACVNACAGMRNDELEGGILIGAMQAKIDRLDKQRDELLAALNEIESLDWKRSLKSLDRPTDFAERQAALSSFGEAQTIASKAIAKAKGGAA